MRLPPETSGRDRGMEKLRITRVGFVLLTHSNPEQILRLVGALNELYEAPPIVCHHDFAQCALDRALFPNNVAFVDPHLPTFWGCFSIVPAALAAMRILMNCKNAPDWLYLLSGSDYPVMSPDKVVSMLAQTRFDAFIDHREITYDGYFRFARGGERDTATGFSRSSYQALAYRRYCAVAVPRPSRQKPFAFPPVGHSYLYHPAWRALVPGPFSSNFLCFAGEHWFTVSNKAASTLLAETSQSERLLAHLRPRESPEECFYHSVLGNSPLALSNNNLRYIHWSSPDAWHPSSLSLDHLPDISNSGAHFARKMAAGSPLLTELDRMTGISQRSFAKRISFANM